MKIERDSNVSPPRSDAADALVRPESDGRDASSTGSTAGAGNLTLSADAEIASAAIRKAAALPEIRQELVERVRKLLDNGELGRDPERLADAIIDSLIDHSVDG
jgi:flagellar biosynthesis anti-sigma factor FlgM